MKLIDKDALVAEIYKLKKSHDNWSCLGKCFHREYETLLSFIETLEVKEMDFDALGILAEHLIACEAHGVTPQYRDREIYLLKKLKKNIKAQKGEKI